MSFLSLFRRLDRSKWFICYDCMGRSGEQPEKAIFYYPGEPVERLGRKWYQCLRCDSINTRSFQFLKDNGEDAALWGLERIVKSHPRRTFEVKRPA